MHLLANMHSYPFNSCSLSHTHTLSLSLLCSSTVGGYNFAPGQPGYMQGLVDQSASTVVSFYHTTPLNTVSTSPTTATSSSRQKSWAHDMIMTENYIITIESSIQFNEQGIIEGRLFAFNKQHKFRLGLALKTATNHTDVKWFEFDRPFGIVHHLSAWEERRNGVDYVVIWAPLGEWSVYIVLFSVV